MRVWGAVSYFRSQMISELKKEIWQRLKLKKKGTVTWSYLSGEPAKSRKWWFDHQGYQCMLSKDEQSRLIAFVPSAVQADLGRWVGDCIS